MQELERVSALVDDAAAGDEPFLKNIAQDPRMRAAWGRYHLIGEVLRDAHTGIPPTAFADRVRAAIAQEPTVIAPPVRHRRALRHPLAAGLALAASITALAIVTFRPGMFEQDGQIVVTSDEAGPVAADARPVALESAGDSSAAAPDTDYGQPEGADQFQRRLSGYLVNFNEQRSNLGVPGVHPYVRIVDFKTESNRQ